MRNKTFFLFFCKQGFPKGGEGGPTLGKFFWGWLPLVHFFWQEVGCECSSLVTKHFRANVQLLSSAAHCPASHSLFQRFFVSFYLCQVFQLTEDCSKFMCFFVTFDIGSLCPLQPTVMIVESPHRATYFCKVVDILDYKKIYRLVYQRMHRLVYSRIYRL